MDRREFIIGFGAALIAAPAAGMLAGCGKSGDDGAPQANSFSVASSVDFSHSHNVSIPFADLANPPSGGRTYESDGATHEHQILLTQAQLTDINNGLTVGPLTSTATGSTPHTHTWTIKKP